MGYHRLEAGRYSIGADPANDIVLVSGSESMGEIQVFPARGQIDVYPRMELVVEYASEEVKGGGTFTLSTRDEAIPAEIRLDGLSLVLRESGSGLALRVRDPQAPTRVGFAGIETFPYDARLRVSARFEAHPPGRTIPMVNVRGEQVAEPNPGRLVFELGSRTFSLETIAVGDRLFVIFADRTNGTSTYGGGRFVYADTPRDGMTVLDFNRAYNPPCAFTEYTTCQLPPPANRMAVAIEAGEKRYSGR